MALNGLTSLHPDHLRMSHEERRHAYVYTSSLSLRHTFSFEFFHKKS